MKRRRLLIAALALPFLPGAAIASKQPYSARLIGGEAGRGTWRAGLDITLDKGWKTYWRVPGVAGIPPQFDCSRSRNLKSLAVLWPAPTRYSDGGDEAVGYKDRIVFPFDIAAEDAGKPIKLDLKVFLGVCEVVCIPVSLDLSLTQPMTTPVEAGLIAAFAARVPQKVDSRSPFRVTRATLIEESGKPALALALEGWGFSKDLDVFVEGGDLAYFHAPRPGRGGSEVQLPIDGLNDMKTLHGRTLTLTMVAGDIRLEQEIVVD
jgi:DsbC/DsbD-like thiol-disulfide interchange protein